MSANEAYVPGLAVAILSVVKHLPADRALQVIVLAGDMLMESQAKLKSMCTELSVDLRFLYPENSIFAQCNHRLNVHSAMYYHLLLPSLLPACDKVLYLDTDMLVESDICPLWDTDISKYPCAAVQQSDAPFVSSPYALENYKELGIAPDTPYCNAGLLLMNLTFWRRENIGERILAYCKEHRDTVCYWDQDGINAVLSGSWLMLNPVWNVGIEALQTHGWVASDPECAEALVQHQRIIHFLLTKPWEASCRHPKRSLFLSYLSQTPFADRSNELCTAYTSDVARNTTKPLLSAKRSRIVSITWARNEADIIEAFVRHHAPMFDKMIIINHRSRDTTAETLRLLLAEGLPIDVRSDECFIHRQGEALTAVLEELRNEPVDWVVPLDVDEFLTTSCCAGVRCALAQLPTDRVCRIPWRTYVPLPDDPSEERNVLRRIGHRRNVEETQWYKILISGSVLREAIALPMGSHDLKTRNDNQQYFDALQIALAHFPVRSAGQIASKVCGGWLSQMANPDKLTGAIFQWKAIFDRVKTGESITPEELQQIALEYGTKRQWSKLELKDRGTQIFPNCCAEDMLAGTNYDDTTVFDPLPVTFTLRYPYRLLPPMQILAESAEELAREISNLKTVAKPS